MSQAQQTGDVVEQVSSPDILNALWQLVVALGTVTVGLLTLALRWSLLIVWIAWWLCGVNWHKAWPVLARGAWVPVVLLLLLTALVWSRLAPDSCTCLGVAISNFWWQLGAVGLLAAVALFCGWLQGVFGWTPTEIDLEPPVTGDMHGHGHAHSEAPKH
jgi:hypothetical protein